ncbi:membrane protein [Micromonospora sagamiensis]|uniref:Dolichyl-phosphate-mannose-protein mannosyltransferase n=1 Tax=Micromonospora sagamiensis TaxID=47875 RepID=A0A562WJ77_9ACTN|nr:hypothetical protein JD81_03888 [Micromonospora sagamiensis]BCL16620.1 membrane protein [Micromonospora sagamiensis]
MVTTEERPSPGRDADTSAAGPGSRTVPGRRLVAVVRHALPALAAYTAVRVLGVLFVYVWARNVGESPASVLSKNDGLYYLSIARVGYDGYARVQSDMAFFPLYPGLVAAADVVSPFGLRETALLVGSAASLAAAWGLFALGNHLHGRSVGVLLAVLWGVLPHAVVESMSYSEGLFTALAAWTLYALLRERWLTAGALCLLAGLARPTASALIPVVALAALVAVVRRRDGWRPWVAGALAPLGWLGYLAWVGRQTGRADGWFHIQEAGWGSSFDFGVFLVQRGREVLAAPSGLQLYVVTGVCLVAIMLFVLSVLDRQPWQLLLYAGLLLATTLGTAGYYHSKARFLIPAFTLLLPIAVGLAQAGRARATTVVVTLAIFSAYYGGYLMMVWGRSP